MNVCFAGFRSRQRRRCMIGVAGNAFGHDFSFWAVAGCATGNARHEDIEVARALRRVMAIVTFHHRVLRMVEFCLRHPAINKNRFGDEGSRVGHQLHFVAERATIK